MSRYPPADQLLEEATEQAGLSEFGPGDFHEGLEVLLGSLEHLPPDTIRVTPDERTALLRARRGGAQLRRIW